MIPMLDSARLGNSLFINDLWMKVQMATCPKTPPSTAQLVSGTVWMKVFTLLLLVGSVSSLSIDLPNHKACLDS